MNPKVRYAIRATARQKRETTKAFGMTREAPVTSLRRPCDRYGEFMHPEARIVSTADELLLDELARTSGDVVLVSPYLSFSVCKRIASLAAKVPGNWLLITRRDPAAVNSGHLNVPGLRELLGAGVTLEHVNRLHAKAFLAGDEFGLIGSANLTERGLGSGHHPNVELGVRLAAEEVAAARSIISRWPCTPLTLADLDELEEEAKHLAKPPRTRHARNEVDSPNVDRLLADASDGRTLWMKAEYGRRDPRRYRGEAWFASPGPTRRPSFKPGDLALIYAQSIHACYAVVEITDEAILNPGFLLAEGVSATEAERWPWISHTIPRLVPDARATVTTAEVGVSPRALQNGHVRVSLAGFAAAVRALEQTLSATAGE